MQNKLEKHVFNAKKINTHCHYMDCKKVQSFKFNEVSLMSYIGWCFGSFNNIENTEKSFENIENRSYYKWFNIALNQIYGYGKLSAVTFDQYNAAIMESLIADQENRRFRDVLHYEHILEDAYWDYGDNLSDSTLFSPSFRVNIFLNGFDRSYVDQDGMCIAKFFPNEGVDLSEYIFGIDTIIKNAKANGSVSLKCAIAYERGLDFFEVTKEKAEQIFAKKDGFTTEDKECFQNYIFYEICRIAAKYDLPFQIHTGLGQLEKTNAINLVQAIKANKNTKFVIFHMSFPYYFDALSLAHNFDNVFVDLCWIPLISESLAYQCIQASLDMVNIDKICWGCDTWTFEESYGAVVAISRVLSRVLSDRIRSNDITEQDAKSIIDKIMYSNAKKLYNL